MKNENRTCREFPEASLIARRNENKTSLFFRAIEEYSVEQNMVYFHFCMQREISLTSKMFYFIYPTVGFFMQTDALLIYLDSLRNWSVLNSKFYVGIFIKFRI